MCFSHDNLRNKASRQLVIVVFQFLKKLGKQAGASLRLNNCTTSLVKDITLF